MYFECSFMNVFTVYACRDNRFSVKIQGREKSFPFSSSAIKTQSQMASLDLLSLTDVTPELVIQLKLALSLFLFF